jgi:hypothetical protein
VDKVDLLDLVDRVEYDVDPTNKALIANLGRGVL